MNRDELEKELEKLHNLLYKIAFSKVNNKEDAEDILAETEYLAVKYIDTLKDKTKFKYWILKILHNQCNKFYKKYDDDQKLLDKVSRISSEAEEDFSLEDTERDKDFEELIKNLNEDEKKIFRLYFKDKITLDNISKTLKENPNTVRSRFRRSKEKLSKMKGLTIILVLLILFSSGLALGAVILSKFTVRKDYKIFYNSEQVDSVVYSVEDDCKVIFNIDFNKNKVNKDISEPYSMYLLNVAENEMIYPLNYEWTRDDVLKIEFDCFNKNLGDTASLHIVLTKGENVTIMLKN